MLRFPASLLPFALLCSLARAQTVSCPALDPSKLALVTFDAFGALLDTEKSLTSEVRAALPAGDAGKVAGIVNDWIQGYESYAGKTDFDSGVQAPQPFVWVIRESLTTALSNAGVTLAAADFDRLAGAWGRLAAKPGAVDVLTRVAERFNVGILSNGDSDTILEIVTNAFGAAVNPGSVQIFSSDYPLGAFNPAPATYDAVIAAVGGDASLVLHVAGSDGDANGATEAGLWAGVLGSGGAALPNVCFVMIVIGKLPDILGIQPTPTPSPSPSASASASASASPGSDVGTAPARSQEQNGTPDFERAVGGVLGAMAMCACAAYILHPKKPLPLRKQFEVVAVH
jgi:hypothetical protein